MIKPSLEVTEMAKRVDLDAMIPREDFAIEAQPYPLDLMGDFPIRHLEMDAPVRKLLRKPDFQRETNHWTPEQVAMLIESFVDSEVIPSLILWKAPRYIFVIDGGHRLSALRAWMENDYGDKKISETFYSDISKVQKEIAERTRKLVEKRVGRYADLVKLVDSPTASEKDRRRAQVIATRALALQWISGDASVAESSFFKINSQGTPLDDTEKLLIVNRLKPIAIAARAILRAGTGHKYWSYFTPECIQNVEKVTQEIHERIFKPEAKEPLKTLELPIGGSVSPIDALALLIEFLTIAGTRDEKGKDITAYANDTDGSQTLTVLKNGMEVLNRMAGNRAASLGLHPAVYFYNEKGKYIRFLFLGIASAIHEKIRNNDPGFFKKFTTVRYRLEKFLIENKSLIGMILQNLGKTTRVSKMKDLFEYLVKELQDGTKEIKPEDAIAHLGLRGRILDVKETQVSQQISDDTKTMVYVKEAIKNAIRCPICRGILDPAKSVSYDHIEPRRSGGTGDHANVQLAHPYCNSAFKELKLSPLLLAVPMVE
jgi:hypothetical protein